MRRSSRYPLYGLQKLALTRADILRPAPAVDVWAPPESPALADVGAPFEVSVSVEAPQKGEAEEAVRCPDETILSEDGAEVAGTASVIQAETLPAVRVFVQQPEVPALPPLVLPAPPHSYIAGSTHPESATDMAEFTARVRNASAVLLDVETTQLSPASPPLKLPRGMAGQATPRLRVVTVGIPEDDGLRTEVFDIQRYPPEHTAALLDAVLRSPLVIGHNLTFDMNWTRYVWQQLHPEGGFPPAPKVSCDTMLLSRLLTPETGEDVGGFTLADIMASIAETGTARMDKQYQKPRNWMPDTLEPEALAYACEDVAALWRWLGTCLPGNGDTLSRLLHFIARPMQTLEARLSGWYESEEFPLLSEILEAWWVLPEMLSDWFLRGQPYSREAVIEYREKQELRLADSAREMVALEPALEPFAPVLSNSGKGFTAPLKQAIGEAFERRGILLTRTEKTHAYQTGTKDLRAAQVTQKPESLALFTPYKNICDIKRRVEMASTYADFARLDGRIHPIFSPVTKTCRLACGEPNMQQVPGDKEFRAFIRGAEGVLISACDVSALDVRVGAALAVRMQRNLRQWLSGERITAPEDQMVGILQRNWVASSEKQTFQGWLETPRVQFKLEKLQALWVRARRAAQSRRQPWAFSVILKELEAIENRVHLHEDRRNLPDSHWRDVETFQEHLLTNTFWQLLTQSEKAGTPTYSALRDAFTLGVDIHSWTGAKLAGVDAASLFAHARTPEEVYACNEELKERIGSLRKLGKVSNLGLMYAMGSDGFLAYCKSTWDIHFLEEGEELLLEAEQERRALSRARELRLQWLEAYPEIQLMILVTDFQGRMYDRRQNIRRKNGKDTPVQGARWLTHTLSGRPIIASSRFTALNYPNQGTGSDILLSASARLRRTQPETYAAIINQVHDEIVLEAPEAPMPEYARHLEAAITQVGSRLLSPFGIPMKAETVISTEWQKG